MRARLNPFSAVRIDHLQYRFHEAGENELLSRLKGLRCRAAILGPQGSGKTTLLEWLESKLQRQGYRTRRLFLSAGASGRPHPPPDFLLHCDDNLLLLVDGAELLGRIDWLRVKQASRAAAGLIITTHRKGMLPALLQCQTSITLLRELVQELAGNDATSLPIEDIFYRHNGNIRDALRELYDLYALK